MPLFVIYVPYEDGMRWLGDTVKALGAREIDTDTYAVPKGRRLLVKKNESGYVLELLHWRTPRVRAVPSPVEERPTSHLLAVQARLSPPIRAASTLITSGRPPHLGCSR